MLSKYVSVVVNICIMDVLSNSLIIMSVLLYYSCVEVEYKGFDKYYIDLHYENITSYIVLEI